MTLTDVQGNSENDRKSNDVDLLINHNELAVTFTNNINASVKV